MGEEDPWKLIEKQRQLQKSQDQAVTLLLPRGNLPSAPVSPRRDNVQAAQGQDTVGLRGDWGAISNRQPFKGVSAPQTF